MDFRRGSVKNRKVIISFSVIVLAIIIVALANWIWKRDIPLDNQSYEGYLFDSDGNVLSEDASVVFCAKVKRSIPFFRSGDVIKGDIAINYGEEHHQYQGILAFVILRESGDYLVTPIDASIYGPDTEDNNGECFIGFEDIGVMYWDTVLPSIVMLGLDDEYCDKYNLARGTVLMLSSEQHTAEELWVERAQFKVSY